MSAGPERTRFPTVILYSITTHNEVGLFDYWITVCVFQYEYEIQDSACTLLQFFLLDKILLRPR